MLFYSHFIVGNRIQWGIDHHPCCRIANQRVDTGFETGGAGLNWYSETAQLNAPHEKLRHSGLTSVVSATLRPDFGGQCQYNRLGGGVITEYKGQGCNYES